jgi:YVTN family beta-propeller protein
MSLTPRLVTSVIATATNAVVKTIPMDQPFCEGAGNCGTHGVAITPDGAFAWVTSPCCATSVIATASNTVVASQLGGTTGVAITPNGAFAYMTFGFDFAHTNIPVIATATYIAVADFAADLGADEIAFTPNGAFGYVTNGLALAGNAVSVFATATNKIVVEIPVGQGFPVGDDGIAITHDGLFVYVANSALAESDVSVIATATNTVVATIPVGEEPHGVAITPPAHAVLSVSVTPNSGSGTSQTFAFKYSDSNGFFNLTNAYAGFGPTAYVEHSCRVEYYRGINKLYLKNDAGTAFLGPLTPGLPGTLSNSQCTLDAGKSSVSGSGDVLTLNLGFSFKPTFVGMQGIFAYAIDKSGLTTPGRQQVGTWDVTP